LPDIVAEAEAKSKRASFPYLLLPSCYHRTRPAARLPSFAFPCAMEGKPDVPLAFSFVVIRPAVCLSEFSHTFPYFLISRCYHRAQPAACPTILVMEE